LVRFASDAESGLFIQNEFHPDLLILDLMLPGMDGIEIARTLRQEMNTPILMLTARDDEIDRVVGLEVGADDYMTKPFSLRELQARVKAMLRRVRLIREEIGLKQQEEVSGNPPLVFDNISLDDERHVVLINAQPLDLKPKEYSLLKFFMENPGKVFSRDQLLREIWGWDFTGESRTVDVHVRWLRQKIEVDPARPSRIVTIRGTGYRFES
jgi:DNA-binding response OmpR family regulator